jgi:hypothetical protein
MRIDPVLAEYAAVRREIEQLNKEIFLIMSASLSLDFVALGWLFNSRVEFHFSYVILTIATLSLVTGDFLLLARNRSAHRLALFQKYFIEPRLPEIYWGRVYFEYRSEYKKDKGGEWGERLALSASNVLLAAILLNVAALLLIGLRPRFTSDQVVADSLQIGNFVFAVLLLVVDLCNRRVLEDPNKMKSTMEAVAKKWGLAGDPPSDSV